MRIPCPACPDGNEWASNGPTGRACPVCGGTAELPKEPAPEPAPDERNEK